MIDDQELRAIQFLAERVRKATSGAAPWDSAGLAANLRKLANRNLHMTVEHVLRHAADPEAKTPGVLAGSYTPPAPTSGGRPGPLRREEQCPRCGERKGDYCACSREYMEAAYADEEPLPEIDPEVGRRFLEEIRARRERRQRGAEPSEAERAQARAALVAAKGNEEDA